MLKNETFGAPVVSRWAALELPVNVCLSAAIRCFVAAIASSLRLLHALLKSEELGERESGLLFLSYVEFLSGGVDYHGMSQKQLIPHHPFHAGKFHQQVLDFRCTTDVRYAVKG